MKRGEVWLVSLDPVTGSEASKTRPVVIVSNDTANQVSGERGRGVVTVAPLTSNVSRVYAFQVYMAASAASGLDRASKVQAEQVRAVDVSRLTAHIGVLPDEIMRSVDQALRLHLAL